MTRFDAKSFGRALVTGAGGFIGSHLSVDLARSGYRVVALDLDLSRVEHLEQSGRFDLLEGDVADSKIQQRGVDGADTVFHLAAAHLGVLAPEEEYWRVNVEATRSLAAISLEAGVRRFIHCSSVGVYGRIRNPPADERSPTHPKLIYEKTKLAGEQVILEAFERGLPAVVLRPAWVYGPGCARTEKLFRALRRGRFVVAGSGRNLRHCIYIRDMVEAFRLSAIADAALGQVIIVGDASAVTVRNLVDEMARVSGSRRPRSAPLPALYLAALAAEMIFKAIGKEPPLSRRTLRFFQGNTAFDTGLARELLGFKPGYDLASGLAETCERLTTTSTLAADDGPHGTQSE